MFVDSSALVAILLGEAPAAILTARLDAVDQRYAAPHVLLEAAMVLASRWNVTPQAVEAEIRRFSQDAGIAIVAIDDATATLAIAAFERFGKGRGNPAQLNFGDCLSYACATQHRVPLLHVGNDFAQTDLA